MTDTNGKWRKLAFEFLVIVLGVLTALGVDEMRQASKDRDREQFYMHQIELDLEATRAQLGPAVDTYRSQLAASQAFLSGLNQRTHRANDSLDVLVRRSSSFPEFRLIMGTIDGLMDGGDLGIVRSPAVRNALLTYRNVVEDAKVQHEAMSRLFLDGLQRIGESANLEAALGPSSDSLEPANWLEATRDPGVPSAALMMSLALVNMMYSYQQVYDASIALSDAIDGAR